MIGHLQQSLGIRLQWEKTGLSVGTANGALPIADGQKDQATQPLGGAAERRRLRHVSQLAVRGLDLGDLVGDCGGLGGSDLGALGALGALGGGGLGGGLGDAGGGLFVLELGPGGGSASGANGGGGGADGGSDGGADGVEGDFDGAAGDFDGAAAAGDSAAVAAAAAGGFSEALERSQPFRTRNPTWEPACGIRCGRHLSAFELRARSLSAAGEAQEVFWSKLVELSELDSLHCEELGELKAPPPPGVPLVQLGKEWFSCPTPSSASAAVPKAAEKPRQRAGAAKKISTSDICSSGDHISAMVARLNELKARSEALRSAMEEPLQRSRENAARCVQRNRCRRRVEELQREVSERRAGLQRLREELERARHGAGAEGAGAEGSAAASMALARKEVEAKADEEASAAAGKALHALWMQLRCRQMRMMHEACTVYPIENQNNGKVWRIRGQVLGGIETLSRMDLREEEAVSTSLGFLVHLVVTLAGILEVPLRFEVRDAGSSRSCVRDLHESPDAFASVGAGKMQLPPARISVGLGGASGAGGLGASGASSLGGGRAGSKSGAPPREWPLYYGRDLKKLQFETALRLLQDALLQFAYSRGPVDEQCSNNLLERVQQILRREFFGPEASG